MIKFSRQSSPKTIVFSDEKICPKIERYHPLVNYCLQLGYSHLDILKSYTFAAVVKAITIDIISVGGATGSQNVTKMRRDHFSLLYNNVTSIKHQTDFRNKISSIS